MADRKGDKSKQPPECKIDDVASDCPHIESRDLWEGESYNCPRCGERYKLYYEDMA